MESLQDYFSRNDAIDEYNQWRRGALGTPTAREEADTMSMIMGGGQELPRPLLRFFDAGSDGLTPMPEIVETSRFYNTSLFQRDHNPFIGFLCQLDNPYFNIETHAFDLLTVYQNGKQLLELPYHRTIDVGQPSFGWSHCARPAGEWDEFNWDVFVFADGRLVARGSFCMI